MHPIFELIKADLQDKGYTFERTDFKRPWGGFFVIDESQAAQFIKDFFPGFLTSELTKDAKVSPKILVVLPEKRLSWQYHHRRSEVWRVLQSEIGVVISDTDDQPAPGHYLPGDIITLAKGERHRLVGLKEIGVLAEIWQHTDPNHPSDEEDIVRVSDDFGR